MVLVDHPHNIEPDIKFLNGIQRVELHLSWTPRRMTVLDVYPTRETFPHFQKVSDQRAPSQGQKETEQGKLLRGKVDVLQRLIILPARLCKGKCDDDPDDPAGGGGGGDPHMRTYDGLGYDRQALGEIVLSKSLDSAFEVQARFEPYRSSRVNVTTGLAVRASDDTPIIQFSISSNISAIPNVGSCSVLLFANGTGANILDVVGSIARLSVFGTRLNWASPI